MGCLPAINETERVYRNELEVIFRRRRIENHALSGVGILKARLFTASFMAGAYIFGGYARGEEDAFEMVQFCSGCAMEPFSNPSYRPSVSREEAISFTSNFMNKILKLIEQELTTGPSTLGVQTDAFRHLVDLYHDCLAETVGSKGYRQRFRDDFSIFAEQLVWSNLRLCTETIDALK